MLYSFGDHPLGDRQYPLAYAATHDHVGDPHRMHACEACDMLLIPAPETVPNTEISERISKLIEALGIKPNAFALALGYNRSQTIYDIVKGKSAPSFDFFNKLAMSEYSEILNMDWVLTGRGEILLSKTPEKPYKENVGKFVGENVGFPKLRKSHTNFEKNVADVVVDKVFKLRTDRLIDRQQIPIYDMEAVAGLVPLFADQYSQSIVGSWRRH